MHSANVLHRDLKPSNLLLVTRLLSRTKAVTCRSVTWDWLAATCSKKKRRQNTW